MEHFDEDYTQEAEDNHSKDLGGNSAAKDNVGVGISMGRAAPSGQVEHEQLKQRVEKIEESLKVLVAYVEGERIRKSEKAKKKKKETLNEVAGEVEVDVDQPIARHVDVPNAQDVHVQVLKISLCQLIKIFLLMCLLLKLRRSLQLKLRMKKKSLLLKLRYKKSPQ
ncbi:uncharacterized protein LOC132038143 [Lycium ferocissimum]|uniref:uncharacterized protein LOC132038143 n=1 Tax=Lycium ferocissimum TaxID=112874 RepID=UPI0028154204|nr:uncharacterized protein LOC132038143 [Lycium ferocissimum]